MKFVATLLTAACLFSGGLVVGFEMQSSFDAELLNANASVNEQVYGAKKEAESMLDNCTSMLTDTAKQEQEMTRRLAVCLRYK